MNEHEPSDRLERNVITMIWVILMIIGIGMIGMIALIFAVINKVL